MAANLCLDKDLKSRVGVALINRALAALDAPLIQEFSVALGEPLKDDKIDFVGEEWHASRKLDGVRCIAIVTEGSVNLLSRKGIPFENFPHIEKALAECCAPLAEEGVVIDGELSIEIDGKDDFAGVMAVLRTKRKVDTTKVSLHCFDLLTLEAFTAGKTSRKLTRRWDDLRQILRQNDTPFLKLVPQLKVKSQDHFDTLIRSALRKGWEGVIARKDDAYIGKRSDHIRKIKKKDSGEFIVTGIATGVMGIVVDGKEVEVSAMTAAFVEHKGTKVRIGSGWSVQERQEFFKDPDAIIGRLITVEFMEESKDSKTGLVSLRHPVVKDIHDGAERVH
jgi:DNA ligase-1